MTIRRKISLILLSVLAFAAISIYFYSQIYLASGTASQSQTVLVEKGENALKIGEKLVSARIIQNKYYLVYYLWRNGKLHSLQAGVYTFQSGVNIPEAAKIITGQVATASRVPITFPEGWTAKDMADRLTQNGFSGDDFLAMVNNPPEQLKDRYTFLSELKDGQTLEGYLFPDTYYFDKDATTQDIVQKMLNNFETKISPDMLASISTQDKSLRDEVIMASIIEKEAKYSQDMKTVSSVFYNRLASGQRLQSDATLEYVLDNNKAKHSTDDLQNPSPYNTYRFAGLPPGPISNPGLDAIAAAINPDKTDYFYFLTDLATKKTIFAKTFAEHVANKAKYGL